MPDTHPEFDQIRKEVTSLTGSELMGNVVMVFCMTQRHFPTDEELRNTMEYLEVRANYPPMQVDCFRIAGLTQ